MIKLITKKSYLFFFLSYLLFALFFFNLNFFTKSIYESQIIQNLVNKKISNLFFLSELSVEPDLIRKISKTSQGKIKKLKLELNNNDLNKILSIINKSKSENNYLLKQEDKNIFFPARLFGENKKITARVKLKGDFIKDHFENINKFSMRVNLDDGNYLYGLNRFSIVNPRTRGFHKSIIYNEFAKKVGLMTPEQVLVELYINDFYCGIMMIEEFISNDTLENNKKRYGPILSIDEDSLWSQTLLNTRKFNNTDTKYKHISNKGLKDYAIKISNIDTSDSNLIMGFKIAESKFNSFLQTRKTKDLFNYDNLSKVFILNNIFYSDHGSSWNNQRFYFDLMKQKFELIIFDSLPNIINNEKILINYITYYALKNDYENFIFYIEKNLKIFDNLLFSRDFKEKIIEKKLYLENILKYEHNDFKFEYAVLENNFHTFEKNIKTISKKNISILNDEKIYLNNSLMTYDLIKENEDNKKSFIKNNIKKNKIELFEPIKFEIIDDKTLGQYFKITNISFQSYFIKEINFMDNKKIKINKYINENNEIKITYNNKIFYDNINMIYIVYIDENQKIKKKVVTLKFQNYFLDELSDDDALNYLKYNGADINFNEKKIIFQNDEVNLNKSINLPINWTLEIAGNSKIFIKNNTFLKINGPLIILGDLANPVEIIIENNPFINISEQSFYWSHILIINNTPYKNFISNLVIKGINDDNLTKRDLITLEKTRSGFNGVTGCLNFYGGYSHINNVNIYDMKCEDALNFISSKIIIEKLKISNSKFDAIDLDFSEGELKNVSILNSGNDAIDLSFSQITSNLLAIKNAKDKGISVGEMSNFKAENTILDATSTGIAVKDDSRVTMKTVKFKNISKFEILSYVKKDRFGGAYIECIDCNIDFNKIYNDELSVIAYEK
jgi:hypothetical protein